MRRIIYRAWPALILLCGLAASTAPGCSCSDTGLSDQPAGVCNRDTVCPEGQIYRKGMCVRNRCDPENSNDDCCPGQICTFLGACVDDIRTCTQDSDCLGGQLCISRPEVYSDSNICSFPLPDENDGCPTGYQLFNGRCITDAPCGGGCIDGTYCEIETNKCREVPTLFSPEHGCDSSCGEGEILVLTDPDTAVFEACCAPECACVTLPGLSPGVYGRYADLAVHDELMVSAYDETYGDLVLARFEKSSGAFLSLEYVDGFPSSGAIVGNPEGLRGGRNGPGPDVGQHTSIAVDSLGHPHIAFYDRELGALKYAAFNGMDWDVHLVHSDGDVGRYTAIVLDENDVPHIAYYMDSGLIPEPGISDERSALWYAEARSANPLAETDWDRYVVDHRAREQPPCDGACPDGYSCASYDSGDPLCYEETSGCASCSSDEICVDVNPAGASCAVEVNIQQYQALPEGVGLFASLVLVDGDPIIVYHDSVDGLLKGSREDSPGSRDFVTAILDGDATPGVGHDVGRFCSAALDANLDLGVAYMNATEGTLYYWSGDVAFAGASELVDDGVTAPDVDLVGADASLAFGGSPALTPFIAYQNATDLDLLLAKGTGSAWEVSAIYAGDGEAHGFYVDLDIAGGTAYAADLRIGFDAYKQLSNLLSVKVFPLP